MRSVELFAGAGGLAMGATLAGFVHEAVVERDRDSCETIRENQARGMRLVSRWPLHETDARTFDYREIKRDIDLLAGGPPCQPFSLGGKHRAHEDERDMFPEVARAVRELRPRAILVENVKGLARQSFARYFFYIELQLAHPEVVRRSGEDWLEHCARLERHHTKGKVRGLSYRIVKRLLNAADYGVPQRRERVFLVGFREDLGVQWSFPAPTHSEDALLRRQWGTGEYWDRHEVPRRARPPKPAGAEARLARLPLGDGDARPWRTVRDAIADLPDPRRPWESRRVHNHGFNPGARPYKGHTGSPLDEPAKTLKAGDHGVPGGENMLRYPSGEVRYFTVRESARLQTFPDDYVFHGSWTESMRQIGNAVPMRLAELIARDIRGRLLDAAARAGAAR